MNKFRRFISIVVLCMATCTICAQNEVSLVVSGEGKNKEEATFNALRSAIEQAYGTFVSANTTILNDQLVADEIVSLSSGNIKKYEYVSENKMPDGNTFVMLSATVSIDKLVTFAESKGMTAELKGGLFAMNLKKMEFDKKAEEKAVENLCKQLEVMLPTLFDYEIMLGEPEKVIDKKKIDDIDDGILYKLIKSSNHLKIYYDSLKYRDSLKSRLYNYGYDDRWPREETKTLISESGLIVSIPVKIKASPNSNFAVFINTLIDELSAISLSDNDIENAKKTNGNVFIIETKDLFEYFIAKKFKESLIRLGCTVNVDHFSYSKSRDILPKFYWREESSKTTFTIIGWDEYRRFFGDQKMDSLNLIFTSILNDMGVSYEWSSEGRSPSKSEFIFKKTSFRMRSNKSIEMLQSTLFVHFLNVLYHIVIVDDLGEYEIATCFRGENEIQEGRDLYAQKSVFYSDYRASIRNSGSGYFLSFLDNLYEGMLIYKKEEISKINNITVRGSATTGNKE